VTVHALHGYEHDVDWADKGEVAEILKTDRAFFHVISRITDLSPAYEPIAAKVLAAHLTLEVAKRFDESQALRAGQHRQFV